jgi:hemerythrin-like domain-containing protein
MSNVVMLLQADHRNMAKLLDLIQQQAKNMARRAPANYRLLESIFAYLSGYPDQCHHPKEDLLYRKLLGRHPDMAGSLKDLVKEHEKLANSTSDMMRAIAASQRDPPAPNERLADQLMEYLDLYRHHMRMEDQHFFPAALQGLSRDDFVEIDFTLFDKPDPLFDAQSEERFDELREEIMRLGAVEKASGDSREEAALLAGFQDIATFNDAMRRSGEPVLLVRSPVEGYELQQKGNVLVHIPQCSESRAAWCAYFYWKAAAPGKAAS